MEQSLKQYFNGCLAIMPAFNNDSYKERLERDYITLAVLYLEMRRK